MVEQVSLASSEFPRGVNEFVKAGLTEVKSEKVKPPRVKESPVSFECKVLEVKTLGTEGGAGNLVICEVILIHAQDFIFNDKGKVDPWKIDNVARMGENYYCRASGESILDSSEAGGTCRDRHRSFATGDPEQSGIDGQQPRTPGQY